MKSIAHLSHCYWCVCLAALIGWFSAGLISFLAAPDTFASTTSSSKTTISTTAAAPLQAYQITGDVYGADISPHVEYLVDPDGLLTLSDVRSLYDHQFKAYSHPQKANNFGINRDIFWLRFSLRNDSQRSINLSIRSSNPLLLQAAVFVYPTDSPSSYLSVLELAALSRSQGAVEYAKADLDSGFRLTLAAGDMTTVLVRLQTNQTASFPLYLDAGKGTYEATFWRHLHLGVVIGLMFGLVFYNLFLYFSVRDVLYLFYIFTGISILFTFAAGNNLLDGTFAGKSDFNGWVYNVMPLFFVASYTQFSRLFFNTRSSYLKTDYFFRFLIVYSLLFVVLEWQDFQREHFVLYYSPFAVIALFFTLLISVQQLRKGYYPAQYFLLGVVVSALGGIWALLVMTGILSSLFSMILVGELVSVAHLVLLSLGIAARIRLLQQEGGELTRQAFKAQFENNAKSEFLQKMSHEIRTPLTGVTGMTDVLKNTSLNAEQRYFVDIIQSSGSSLLSVIDDIRDYSCLEDGTLTMHKASFDLYDLVKECADIFELIASNKKLGFVFHIKPATPRFLVSDMDRVKQVLINLIGNAIKFTSDGSIQVIISAEYRMRDGRLSGTHTSSAAVLRFEVVDSGVGIAESVQQGLFQSFTQADSSTARHYGGSGLGLTISRRICDMLNGDIGVESKPGQGSTFWFSIPIKLTSDARQVESVDHRLAELRFFLILEDSQYAQYLQQQLECWGVRECVLNSPAEFSVAKLYPQERDNTVVLLDGALEDIQIQHVVQRSNKEDVPVIGLVHFNAGQERERLLEAGVVQHISLPAAILLMKDALLTVLFASGDPQQQTRQAGQLVREGGLPIMALVVEDDPLNQRVITKMLQNLSIQVESCNSGSEAVNRYCQSPKHYHLLVVDCDLRGISGIEVTQRIRAYERQHLLEPVPLLGISAYTQDDYRQEGLKQGMNGYLAKPFHLDSLHKLLLDISADFVLA